MINKAYEFKTAVAMDREQKDANKARALATIAKAQAWEMEGHRKASKCIVVVEGDKAIKADILARKARAKAIQDEQKRLFAEMVIAFNLENEIAVE